MTDDDTDDWTDPAWLADPWPADEPGDDGYVAAVAVGWAAIVAGLLGLILWCWL